MRWATLCGTLVMITVRSNRGEAVTVYEERAERCQLAGPS